MAVAVGPRILELSVASYQEIEEKLLSAGYDWLVLPGNKRGIPMDGFVIRCERSNVRDERSNEHRSSS
jgi:hypothetical protein